MFSETFNVMFNILVFPLSIKSGVKNWFLVLKTLPLLALKSMLKIELLGSIRKIDLPK